jgi:predicted nucleic acid-binding protein
LLASPRVDIIPVTGDTAQRYALILNDLRRSGAIIPTNDIWIAVTAMEHGLRLLTTNSHTATTSAFIRLLYPASNL